MFFDYYGGIPTGQIIHVCGPSGSGKTIFATYLTSRFLETFAGSLAIYFDADRRLAMHDLQRLCDANSISTSILDRLKVFIPSSWSDVLSTISRYSGDSLMIVIDSLPNIFVGEQYKLVRHDVEMLPDYLSNILHFMKTLQTFTTQKNFTIILINQVRSLTTTRRGVWGRMGFIPAFWNIINSYIDTCIILEKIHHNTIYLRVYYSLGMPETIYILKLNADLKIY